jgi:hypothetical protein
VPESTTQTDADPWHFDPICAPWHDASQTSTDSMTQAGLEEYRELRATIRERGTARTCVFVAGTSFWALTTIAVAATALPLLTVIPLLLLAATFEAVFALHVGVERLGRYLQVFHQDRWEETAMAFGAPLAQTSSDPLFTGLFALATVCNYVPVVVAEPVPSELSVIGAFHILVLARLVAARRAAGRQRAADLERFQQIRQRSSSS